ncbi:hypothetical protein EVAR_94114_1 [Eumeta japonica]|uniref:Uncharacterized protein n=1 Tax=Eumeta variegata TaxID=151549 RepID=A0A4C1U885_EUMVA|nr:hypothetical protein EVAR_94114_1 [Eumeta japonica]
MSHSRRATTQAPLPTRRRNALIRRQLPETRDEISRSALRGRRTGIWVGLSVKNFPDDRYIKNKNISALYGSELPDVWVL